MQAQQRTVAGGGDGVEADAVGLALARVDARRDDAVGLPLPVRQLACSKAIGCEKSVHDHPTFLRAMIRGKSNLPTIIALRVSRRIQRHRIQHSYDIRSFPKLRGIAALRRQPLWSITMLQMSPGAFGPTMLCAEMILPTKGFFCFARFSGMLLWSK